MWIQLTNSSAEGCPAGSMLLTSASLNPFCSPLSWPCVVSNSVCKALYHFAAPNFGKQSTWKSWLSKEYQVIAKLNPILQTMNFSRRKVVQSKIIITSTHSEKSKPVGVGTVCAFTNTRLLLFMYLTAYQGLLAEDWSFQKNLTENQLRKFKNIKLFPLTLRKSSIVWLFTSVVH